MPRTKAKSRAAGDGASVAKAIALLRMFIDGQERWGVRELAQSLGQPGSSVHRLLQILRSENLLQWDPESRKYSSGTEFFRWSAVLNRRLKWAELARPIMADLSESVGESCWLGLLDPKQRLHAYVAEFLGSRPLCYSAGLGEYKALPETAGGRVLQAFLPEPQRQRPATKSCGGGEGKRGRGSSAPETGQSREASFVVEEGNGLDLPLTVSAPIFDARNRPFGSLTVAMPSHRYTQDRHKDIQDALLKSSHLLSRLIGSQVLGGGGLGVWHQGLNGVANLIHRRMPAFNSTIGNCGGDGAIRALQVGKGGYTFAVADSLEAAFKGEPPFDRPHERLRAMFSFLPLYLHVLSRRGSGLSSLDTIKGHLISGGERDFTTARVLSELLDHAGLGSPNMLKRHVVFLDYAEAQRQFVAGKLSAIASLTGLGDSSYRNLSRRVAIDLVALDAKSIRRFVEAHPTYEIAEIPANTYEGCDRPILTIMVPTIMVTTADRSDDEVHQVIQAVYHNRAELSPISLGFSDFNPKSILRGVRIPFHPAAERFWIDQGLMEPAATPRRR